MSNGLAHAIDEFLHSPIQVTAAVVAICGAVSAIFKAGRRFWKNVWSALRARPVVPRETVRMVQDARSSFWATASLGEKAAMQVVLDGYVTNISSKPSRILKAEIPKPLTYAQMVLLSNHHDARRPQLLAPDESAEIRVCFFVQPMVAKMGRPWRSTVFLIDQYGNRHKIKNCLFRSIGSEKPLPPKEPEEYLYEISDPIEKEVVAVLRAELNRYALCGRRCGGLGSVHLKYQGQSFSGVGGDSWTPDSPANQIIVSNPEAASLESDNLEALICFYRELRSDEHRGSFSNALLYRLNANRGYLAVAYFIVAALWRVGLFAEALRRAKMELPTNETRVYGLSNVLRLLNGLLMYRHQDFTDEMLDEIERLTHGLNEHVFFIPEKIAAIRTSRLSGTSHT